MSRQYETVIGLEVHVELATKMKIFCSCSTEFGGAPNTHTCPVCTGMPGALPVLNRQVVEYALAVGLATNCKILIFDEPTRGIDVGAKQEIYHLIREMTDQGKAVIMISSEMPELIGMSDRILVMADGRLKGEIGRGDFTQEHILEMASDLD